MRWIRKTEFVLLACVACVACSEPISAPIAAAHPDDPMPRKGGTYHFASFGDIKTLDPVNPSDSLSAGVLEHVFAGLVDFDPDGKVVPDIAERYDVSPDGLLYTFEMRRNVLFHDGEEVTADDVKRSIERALHKDTPNPYSSYFEAIEGYGDYAKGKTESLASVRAEGRYVLSVRLAKPDAMFLSVFALLPARPTCKSAGNRFSDDWVPCGAGPFKLAESGWERGRTVTLVRHEKFFKPGLPYLDRIVWSFGMSPLTQRYQLESGDLDGNRELSLVDALRFSRDERWKPFGSYEAENTINAINMNVEVPPFDNVEVRRAVACALDREHIRLVRSPNLRPLGRIFPPPITGDDPDFPSQKFDLEAAKEHMRRAGLPDGWPKPITYLVYRQGLDEQTAQVFQQQLAPLGLNLEIRLVNYPTFIALTHRRHEVAMSPGAWQEDFPDGATLLEPLFTTAAINDEDSNNTAFYSNKTLDDLLGKARVEMDTKKRAAMYREADAIVTSDAPWATVFSYRYYAVHQPYVRNYKPNVVFNEDVREVWLDRDAKTIERKLGSLLP